MEVTAPLRIVVLDGYTMNPGDLSWAELEALGEVTIHERTPFAETVARCQGASIVLTNKTLLPKEHLAQLPDLRYVGLLSTGVNVVDLAYAREHGIAVANVPAYSTASVVQLVFAHLLHYTQRVAIHADAVAAGDWVKSKDFAFTLRPLIELAGLRMGVIGLGDIGRGVAKVAAAFGMEVVAQTRTIPAQLPSDVSAMVDLETLLATSDVIALCCPLTPQTQHLLNTQTLAKTKRGVVVINTGRGPLIDEAALAGALKSGQVGWAGLDVLSQEPPPASNPLLSAPNCAITPHIAWATHAARGRLYRQVVANIQAFLDGKRLNRVE